MQSTITAVPLEVAQTAAEDIAFDKAERAEQLETEKQQLMDEISRLDEAIKQALDDDEKQTMQAALVDIQARLKLLKETPEGLETD